MMEEDLPNWLDKTLLEQVLQDQGKRSLLTVVDFTIKPALTAGSNYTTKVYRIYITYTVGRSPDLESLDLIVKVPHDKGMVNEMTEGTDFFSTEPKFYGELLPKMCKKIKYEFAPKFFYCPVKGAMILKDLKTEGYVMCNRMKQMDFSHCEIVFINLAKFHATSVACYHNDPHLIECLGREHIYAESGGFGEQFRICVELSFKHFLNILKQMNDQQMISDMVSKKADIWKSLVNICKPKKNGLNVLNHGDCWSPNMLFKYDETGKVIDVKLIDYQVLRYGSPVLDLIHVFWTTAQEEVREHKQCELFNIYLETLNKTLDELGCKERMSLEEFENDLKNALDFVIATVVFEFPFTACEPENVIDMENINCANRNELDEMWSKMFSSKNYKMLLPGILQHLKTWIS